MSKYDRERMLVREREGIEFAADIREAAQESVFKSLDMVHRNPLQVSMPACMFSSSTAQFTWISMQIKVTTVGVSIYFFFFGSVYLHACFLARQLDFLGFQCRLK